MWIHRKAAWYGRWGQRTAWSARHRGRASSWSHSAVDRSSWNCTGCCGGIVVVRRRSRNRSRTLRQRNLRGGNLRNRHLRRSVHRISRWLNAGSLEIHPTLTVGCSGNSHWRPRLIGRIRTRAVAVGRRSASRRRGCTGVRAISRSRIWTITAEGRTGRSTACVRIHCCAVHCIRSRS